MKTACRNAICHVRLELLSLTIEPIKGEMKLDDMMTIHATAYMTYKIVIHRGADAPVVRQGTLAYQSVKGVILIANLLMMTRLPNVIFLELKSHMHLGLPSLTDEAGRDSASLVLVPATDRTSLTVPIRRGTDDTAAHPGISTDRSAEGNIRATARILPTHPIADGTVAHQEIPTDQDIRGEILIASAATKPESTAASIPYMMPTRDYEAR